MEVGSWVGIIVGSAVGWAEGFFEVGIEGSLDGRLDGNNEDGRLDGNNEGLLAVEAVEGLIAVNHSMKNDIFDMEIIINEILCLNVELFFNELSSLFFRSVGWSDRIHSNVV